MYFLVKPIAWSIPVTIPSLALKDVMTKGHDLFSSKVVFMGFLSQILSIISCFIGMIFVMRKKKFSKN